MPTMRYVGCDGELTIESDSHVVYGRETSWAKNWKMKDDEGHWHFFGSDDEPFPTLQMKPKKCYSEDDEWEESRYYCKQCDAEIMPKQTIKEVAREVKGITRYILTQEVTEETAKKWLEAQNL